MDTQRFHRLRPRMPPWLARCLLALAFVASICFADPAQEDPHGVASDHDYASGQQAIERMDWRRAAWHFDLALLRHPENADVHNYLGYAYRHLGQFELAFKHYGRALELNPRHRGAHEYAGEAHLMAGDLASAEKHLEALRLICLLPCDELADLEREIARYLTKSGAGRK